MREVAWGTALVIMLISIFGCVTRSDHALVVDGDRRTYELRVPASYSESNPMPLVLVLHPFTATGKSMAWMTGLDRLAQEKRFIAVFPDGNLRQWRAVWKSDKDVRFLEALIDTVEAEYAVDESRVYLVGASNGAHMTYRMLCEDGERFAAAAVVMGAPLVSSYANCSEARPAPLLMIHGTKDPVLPWRGRRWPRRQRLLSMEETVEILTKRNECTGEGIEEEVGDAVKNDGTRSVRTRYEGDAPLVVYRVEGGGHTWPGGVDNYPEWVVGKTSRDFDASAVIWDFFEECGD